MKKNPAKPAPNATAALKLHTAVQKLRRQGMSIKAIAKELHKSDRTIAAIVKNSGIGIAPAPKKPAPKKPAVKKPAQKPLPPKGVPGVDVIKIELSKEQQFALFVAAHIMELADEINKVIAKVFNKGN